MASVLRRGKVEELDALSIRVLEKAVPAY